MPKIKKPKPVTLENLAQWSKMTMAEKLEFVKNRLKIKDDAELGKRLGVTNVAISCWRHNTKKPRQKHLDKLFELSGLSEWLSDKYGRDAFLSQFTVSFDSVKGMFKDLTELGNDLTRSNAMHAVAAKIAYVLEQMCKSDNIVVVIHFHSIFGTPDGGEIMNITIPTDNTKSVDVCVKLGLLNNEISALYIVEMIQDGIVATRNIGVVTDSAIAKITNNIYRFIK